MEMFSNRLCLISPLTLRTPVVASFHELRLANVYVVNLRQ